MTGVQTCALPICSYDGAPEPAEAPGELDADAAQLASVSPAAVPEEARREKHAIPVDPDNETVKRFIALYTGKETRRKAVEEALANAVYHRAYDIREPIEVRISPEEIVILSYPGPDRSVRLDQLRLGRAVPRRYRNRRIGDFLKELDITEGRSTGIPKILRVMSRNGSPPPEFEFDEDHSYFLVRLPVHPQGRQTSPGTTEATPQVAPQVTPQVSKLAAALYGEMSAAEVMKAVGIKDRVHFREAYIQPALRSEFVEMTIPDKPTSRLQKYRLTSKGRALLVQSPPKTTRPL